MTQPWYRINAASAGPAELSIFGDIGEQWWAEESITAKSISAELKPLSGRDLKVRINSYGGSVADGLAIYNALRRHAQSATVTTAVEGVAMSIASLIFMAGDVREMASNSLYMVHAPWGDPGPGNARYLRQTADMLDKYAESMASAYARSALTADEVKALLTDGEDHFFSAAEAEEAGFVTAIREDLPIAASYFVNRFTQRTNPVAQITLPAPAPITPMESPMTTENPQAGAEPVAEPVNVASIEAAAQAKAMERVKARNAEVRAMIKKFERFEGIDVLAASLMDDPTISPDDAGKEILEFVAKGVEPLASNPRIEPGADEADKRRLAVANALMARAGVLTGQAADSARHGNPYAFTKLYDLAVEAAERTGFKTKGADPISVVKAAINQGTSDFPVVLQDTMHKTLQAAFSAASDTWSQFCDVGEVSDFREWKRIYTGSISSLDTVGEMAEFTHKAIPDGKAESVSVTTKGNIVSLSRQAIINDDLSYFLRVTQMLGRAAARSIERDAYALLAANPIMDDGYALFSTQHANYDSTGDAIGIASLVAARNAMRSQMDISGNDYIDGNDPVTLLCPLAKGQLARETILSVFDPETSNKLQRRNDALNIVSTIIDTPRLSNTGWYIFANPQINPVMEVTFLNGIRAPYIEAEQGFEVDGIRYKVRLDYGVSPVGYQGAYHNVGA